MKQLKDHISESLISESCHSREEIEEKCPEFWKAVSQFCRDKNSEAGIDWLIAAWTCDDPKEFEKNNKNTPFNSEETREFEEKYLTDAAIKEIEKINK